MKNIKFGRAEWAFSLRAAGPIIFTYVLVGMGFGIMAYDTGLSLLWTSLSSIFVYTGAGQIALVSLIRSGSSILGITLVGLAIGARFAFYGVSLVDRFKKAGPLYPLMIFGLTDEAYSLLVSLNYPSTVDETGVNALVVFELHFFWLLGSVLGHVFGQGTQLDLGGIDFMLTAFFIAIVVAKWKEGMVFPIIAGLVLSIVCLGLLGPDAFIVPSIVLTIVAILVKQGLDERKEVAEYEN